MNSLSLTDYITNKKNMVIKQRYSILSQKLVKSLFLFIWMLAAAITLHAQSGANDPSFNPSDVGFGTGGSTIEAITFQSDGKILVGGGFLSYNGVARKDIVRLNSDGTLDATFDPGTGFDLSTGSIVTSIVLQTDGKILVGGEFTSYNGTPRNRIARLNSDGSLDASFNPGTGFNGPGGSYNGVSSIALQPDGKILVGGFFTTYNGTSQNRIARLNSNGSLDASFNPGTGASSELDLIELLSDGKILIGGSFTSYNGTVRNFIARLNSDGSLDATFNSGSGANNTVYSLAVQSDGKILIGGAFTTYEGTARSHVARLNADGSLDATFNPGTGATITSIYSLTLQTDGNIVIVGAFDTYNGTSRNHIARIDTNGALDASFDLGTGTDGTLYYVTEQSAGKILIGGSFSNYNGVGRNSIARIFSGSSSLPVTIQSIRAIRQESNILIQWQVQYENNILSYEIERSGDDNSFQKAGAQLAIGGPVYDWIDHDVKAGIYYYRIRAFDRDGMAKYSPIAKAIVGEANKGFGIYPNPLLGATLNLRFINQPSGKYTLKLFNSLGQAVLQQQISHTSGSSIECIAFPEDLQKGGYFVELTLPGGSRQVFKILNQQ